MSLFRVEVATAQRSQWLGSIRVHRPRSFGWIVVAAVVCVSALVAFAALGEFSKKARLPGLLVPRAGIADLTAPQSGVITEVKVIEGDTVVAGQVLMRIRSERTTAAGETAALNAQALVQRRLTLETERLLTQQQARQRQDALAGRLQSLQIEERHAQAELDTNRLRARLALKSQERYDELAKDGFVSSAQAQQKQEEVLDLQLRERNAARSLQSLMREIHSLQAEVQANAITLRTNIAQLERSMAGLSQESIENEARGGLVVIAPQAGRITALDLRAGQPVQLGQTLLSLVPTFDGQQDLLEAQLYATSRTAGFVQTGQTVWLRYAAYPHQKFGMAEGRVQRISQTPISAPDLPNGQAQALLTAVQANEPLYRIAVSLKQQHINTYGHTQPLRAGMQLDADVVQDRRAVWEWIFEPLLAARSLVFKRSDR